MQKLVFISDFHVPFEDKKVINSIYKNHGNKDTICIIGGDLFDNYALSDWPKKKRVSLEEEYERAYNYVQRASHLFKEVHLIQGNHEAREDRNLIMKTVNEARFLINQPLLKRLAAGHYYDRDEKKWEERPGFDNVHCALDEEGNPLWYKKIGKTLFAHPFKQPSRSTLVNGGDMAHYVWSHFTKMGEDLDCVITGHVHKVNVQYAPYAVLIEGGGVFAEQGYTKNDPSMRFKRQVQGFVLAYQDDDGNIDRRNTRPVCLS